MDPRKFPFPGDPDCSHFTGLYKSGRCVVCGYKVRIAMKKNPMYRVWKRRESELALETQIRRGGWEF